MTGPTFVDTNVLVYARDAAVPEKQHAAAQWMSHLWQEGTGRLSFQVLQEYYVVVTQKLTPGLGLADARAEIRTLYAWDPVAVDASVIDGAWRLQDRYGLAWWDALIVAAAEQAGCPRLLTEDLQAGQELGTVTIVSPFDTAPPLLRT
jgi:predicted nucleic acid-binding protein